MLVYPLQEFKAQQTLLSASGKSGGLNGSVEYSIGELLAPSSGEEGSIADGIQQPYESLIPFTTNLSLIQISPKIKVYPSPTRSYINLELGSHNRIVNASLFDSQGRHISTLKTLGLITKIHLDTLLPGVYILKVKTSSSQTQSFRVIKML